MASDSQDSPAAGYKRHIRCHVSDVAMEVMDGPGFFTGS